MQAVRYILLLGSILFTVTLWSQIPVNTNFNPAIAAPMDVRSKINTLSDTATILFKYDGMITYVVSNQKTYVRKPGVWEEIGAGAGGVAGVASINGETGIVSLKTVNSVPISGSGNIEVDTMVGLNALQLGRLGALKSPTDRDSVIQVYWGGTSVTSISTETGFFNWLREQYGDSGNREFRFSAIGGGVYPWPSNSPTIQPGDWVDQGYAGRNFYRLVGTSTSVPITLKGLAKRVVFTYSTEIGGGTFDIRVNGITRTINCNAAQSINNEEVWDFDSIVPIDVLINNVVGGDVYLEHIRFLQNKPGVEILYGAMGGSSIRKKREFFGSYPAWEREPIPFQDLVGVRGEFQKRTENYKPKIMVLCWTVNDINADINVYNNMYKATLDSIVKWNDSLQVQTLFIPEPGGHTAIPSLTFQGANAASYDRMVKLMFNYAKTKDHVSILPWGPTIQEGYNFNKNIDILKYQQKYYPTATYDSTSQTFSGDFIHPNYLAYNQLGEMLKYQFQLTSVDPWNYNVSKQTKLHISDDKTEKGVASSLYFLLTLADEPLYETKECNLWPHINTLINASPTKSVTLSSYFGYNNITSKPYDTVTLVVEVNGTISIQLRNGQNSSNLSIVEKGKVIQTDGALVTSGINKGLKYYYVTFILDASGDAGIVLNGTYTGVWITKGKNKQITKNDECWNTDKFPVTYQSLPAIELSGFARSTTDTTVKKIYISPALESSAAAEFNVSTSYRVYKKSSFIENGIIHESNPNRFFISQNNNILTANEKYSIFFKAAVIDTITGVVSDIPNYRVFIYNGATNVFNYYNPITKTWSSSSTPENYQPTQIDGASYLTFNMPSGYIRNNADQLYVEFQQNPYVTLVSSIYIAKGDSLYVPNAASVLYPNIDTDRRDEFSRLFRAKKQIGNLTSAAAMFQCDMTLQSGTAYQDPNSLIHIRLTSERGYRVGLADYIFARSNFQDIAENTLHELIPRRIDNFPGGINMAEGALGLYVKRTGVTFKFWVLAQEDNMFATVYADDISIAVTTNTDAGETITGSETKLFSVYANYNRYNVFEPTGDAMPDAGGVVLHYSNFHNGFVIRNGATTREIVDVPTGALTNDHVVVVSGTTFSTRADKEGVTSVTVNAGPGISVTGSPITSSGILTVTNTGDADASDDITGESIPVTHDFPSIAVGGIQSATVTVAGANAGKVLVVNADLPDGVLLQIKSTSPDTARLTIFNFTGALYDPSLTTFEIRVLN